MQDFVTNIAMKAGSLAVFRADYPVGHQRGLSQQGFFWLYQQISRLSDSFPERGPVPFESEEVVYREDAFDEWMVFALQPTVHVGFNVDAIWQWDDILRKI